MDTLRGPTLAYALLLAIWSSGVLCLGWCTYHRPVQPPGRCWSLFFAWAQSSDVWTERLWMLGSLYVVRSHLHNKHATCTPRIRSNIDFHHKLLSLVLKCTCYFGIVLEFLFLFLSFPLDSRLKIGTVVVHCLWTTVWSGQKARSGAAAAQLISVVALVHRLHCVFLLVFFLTFSGLVIFQQRTSNGCLDRPESIQSTTVAATATGGAEYKVCMIGSAGAGKTATIAIYGLQMPPNGYVPTMIDSYTLSRTVYGEPRTLRVLDVGDCTKYRKKLPELIDWSDICIAAFSTSSRDTFEQIQQLAEANVFTRKLVLLRAVREKEADEEVTEADAQFVARTENWHLSWETGDPFLRAAEILRQSRSFRFLDTDPHRTVLAHAAPWLPWRNPT